MSDETVFLTESLPGHAKREWLTSGKPYTESSEQRTVVATAIEEMNWQRPDQPMAMSPALLLKEVIAQLGLRMVARVGYSIHEILHPDCDCPHPYGRDCPEPDHWASYQLVGIKIRQRQHWWTLYFLDIGVGAVWLVSDLTDAPLLVNVSVACAKEWHDRCTGTYKHDDSRHACACSCPHSSGLKGSDIGSSRITDRR